MLGHVWLDEAKAKRVNGPQSAANPSQLQTASPLLNRGPGVNPGMVEIACRKDRTWSQWPCCSWNPPPLCSSWGPALPGHRDTTKPLTGGRCNEVYVWCACPMGATECRLAKDLLTEDPEGRPIVATFSWVSECALTGTNSTVPMARMESFLSRACFLVHCPSWTSKARAGSNHMQKLDGPF
jgi:hypothetical protein